MSKNINNHRCQDWTNKVQKSIIYTITCFITTVCQETRTLSVMPCGLRSCNISSNKTFIRRHKSIYLVHLKHKPLVIYKSSFSSPDFFVVFFRKIICGKKCPSSECIVSVSNHLYIMTLVNLGRDKENNTNSINNKVRFSSEKTLNKQLIFSGLSQSWGPPLPPPWCLTHTLTTNPMSVPRCWVSYQHCHQCESSGR